MRETKIGIVSWGSISALGMDEEAIWANYQIPETTIAHSEHLGKVVSKIPTHLEEKLDDLKRRNRYYAHLDRSVLLGIIAAEQAWTKGNWSNSTGVGVNIGSSRGATGVWEHYHQEFLAGNGKVSPLSSPLTTLGNLSTWVAHHLGIQDLAISHSITCSSALHAFMNAIAHMQAGHYTRFLVGGAEAPLTAFTIAQMQALRIYSSLDDSFPCRALEQVKTQNTMVLGEGAACFCLEVNPIKPLAWVEGIGWGMEPISSATSLSLEGKCLQTSMKMGLGEVDTGEVDLIITHSPGTIRGDQSERNAIEAVFSKNIPIITTNKWKIGHTLGASGGLSVELALLLLKGMDVPIIPYLTGAKAEYPIRRILVNAVGFGGNACSILLCRNEFMSEA